MARILLKILAEQLTRFIRKLLKRILRCSRAYRLFLFAGKLRCGTLVVTDPAVHKARPFASLDVAVCTRSVHVFDLLVCRNRRYVFEGFRHACIGHVVAGGAISVFGLNSLHMLVMGKKDLGHLWLAHGGRVCPKMDTPIRDYPTGALGIG